MGTRADEDTIVPQGTEEDKDETYLHTTRADEDTIVPKGTKEDEDVQV